MISLFPTDGRLLTSFTKDINRKSYPVNAVARVGAGECSAFFFRRSSIIANELRGQIKVHRESEAKERSVKRPGWRTPYDKRRPRGNIPTCNRSNATPPDDTRDGSRPGTTGRVLSKEINLLACCEIVLRISEASRLGGLVGFGGLKAPGRSRGYLRT